MWWAGNNAGRAADAYLGNRRVRLQWRDEALLDEFVPHWREGLERLRSVVEGYPARLRLRVWLSGGLCRPFLVSEFDGVESSRDWLLVAEAMAQEATGLMEPCEVWISAERSAPRLAVALEQVVKSSVLETLGPTRLLGLRPWWGEVLKKQALLDQDISALAVQDCESLTLLLCGPRPEAQWISVQSCAAEVDASKGIVNRLLMSSEWMGGEPSQVRLAAPGATTESANGMAVFSERAR